MKKIICDVAVTADLTKENGEFHFEVHEKVMLEIGGDRPTWPEIEKQLLMTRHAYDIPEWKLDSARWDDEDGVVVFVLSHVNYGNWATCFVRTWEDA